MSRRKLKSAIAILFPAMAIVSLGLLLHALARRPYFADGKAHVALTETYVCRLLNELPSGWHSSNPRYRVESEPLVSLEGGHLAYVKCLTEPKNAEQEQLGTGVATQGPLRQAVVLDGVQLAAYDEIRIVGHGAYGGVHSGLASFTFALKFSPDGSHLAYVARTGDKWRVVLDGAKGRAYNEIVDARLDFNQDGSKLAYIAREGDRYFVVVNGREGKRYASVTGLTLSGDGRPAYIAQSRGKQFVVAGVAESDRHDEVRSPAWSGDGRHFGYAARSEEAWSVIVDDDVRWQLSAGEPGQVTLNNDGSRAACVVQLDACELVETDGVRGRAFDSVRRISFSGDGKLHYSSTSHRGGGQVAFIEGRPIGKSRLRVEPIKGAFAARFRDNIRSILGMPLKPPSPEKYRPVAPRWRGPGYDWCLTPLLSPDGKHIAYLAREAGRWHVYVDGYKRRALSCLDRDGWEFLDLSLGNGFYRAMVADHDHDVYLVDVRFED